MKLSIIVATYNAAHHIKNLLSSIARQKNDNVELIFIDGNSTDNTVDIIKSFGMANIIISENDLGIYDAWNKGIVVSSGEWIMFIGADDIFEDDILKFLIGYIESTEQNIDYICGKSLYIDGKNNVVKIFGEPPTWEQMKKWNVAAHVASLHNRRLFSEVGKFNIQYKICADYELLLRKREGLNYVFLDLIFARMLIGGASYSYQAIRECFFIRRKLNTVFFFQNLFILTYSSLAFFLFKIRIRFWT